MHRSYSGVVGSSQECPPGFGLFVAVEPLPARAALPEREPDVILDKPATLSPLPHGQIADRHCKTLPRVTRFSLPTLPL